MLFSYFWDKHWSRWHLTAKSLLLSIVLSCVFDGEHYVLVLVHFYRSSALFPSFVFWGGEEPSCQFVSYNSHNFHTHEIIQWPPHAILMGELSSWKSPLQLDEKCFIIHCTAVTLPSPRTSEPKRCSHKSCRCSDHALICNMSVCRRMRYFPTGRDKNKAKNRVNNRIFILSVANFQLLPTRQVLIKKIYKRTTERRTICDNEC